MKGMYVLAAAAVITFTAGCAEMTPRQQSTATGGAVGAVGGAIIGNQVGSPVTGAVVGGAAGALIGNQVGRNRE